MAYPRRIAFAAALLSLALAPTVARAQDEAAPTREPAPAPSPSPTPPPTTPRSIDTIYLTNGGLYRGRIIEIIPEDHVTIVVGGEEKRVAWEEIRRITADVPVKTSTVVAAPTSPSRAEEPPRPVPPPKPRWQPNKPFFITGACAFGLAYGLTLLVATPSVLEATGRFLDGRSNLRAGGVALVIPFVGPIIFAEGHGADSVLNRSGGELSDGLHDMLWVSAVVQIAGGAAMITGLALGGTPAPPKKESGAYEPRFRLAPLVAPSAAGVSLNVTQW